MKLVREHNNNNSNKNRVTVIDKPLDENNRFCKSCHLALVKKQGEGVYSCPRCNVSAVVMRDTYPNTKLRTTFPTYSPYEPVHTHVMQSETQKISRSEEYIRKRAAEKNAGENNDPFLKMLKGRGDIHLTNIEYYNVEE